MFYVFKKLLKGVFCFLACGIKTGKGTEGLTGGTYFFVNGEMEGWTGEGCLTIGSGPLYWPVARRRHRCPYHGCGAGGR